MAIEDIPEEMRTQEGLLNENKQMILEVMSKKVKIPLYFVENGVKINSVYYQQEILGKILKEEGPKMYTKTKWTFQHDSVLDHNAMIIQK